MGFATLEVYSRKFSEIRSLCVSRDVQGYGIGRRLVAACVELARERRIFEIMVITSQDNFFLGCGFDFTLPGEVTDYVLSVGFDKKGKVRSIDLES